MEKTVWPCSQLEFLGILIDSELKEFWNFGDDMQITCLSDDYILWIAVFGFVDVLLKGYSFIYGLYFLRPLYMAAQGLKRWP